MGAIWFRARAEIRSRRRATLALVLLLGVFGGAVFAVASGARRTDTAYSRFLSKNRSFDVVLGDFSVFAPVFWKPDFEALEALSYVSDSMRSLYFVGDPPNEGRGSADPRYGKSFVRRKILEGREAIAVDEVLVPFASRSLAGTKVGDTVEAQYNRADGSGVDKFTFKVVGISVEPGDFPPVDLTGDTYVVSPEFIRRYGDELFAAEIVMLRFKNGAADLERFDSDLERLAGKAAVFPFRMADHAKVVQRSFGLQAAALWLLAGLLSLTATLMFTQTVARQVALESDDNATLRALAMSRNQLIGVSLIRTAVAAVAGTLVAVGVAIAASPLFPLGSARIAEPVTGIALDWTVLGLGSLFLIGTVIAVAIPAALRTARRARLGETAGASGGERPSAAASLAARAGLPVAAIVGVRHALEPGAGRTAVPVRSTILAVTIGLASLGAAFTFAASLDHLLGTPRLYGVAFDHVYGFDEATDARRGAQTLAAEPDVEAVTIGASGIPATVDGIAVEGMEIKSIKGSVFLPPIEGRLPGPGEMFVGPRTLREIGKHVGDHAQFGVQGVGAVRFRISGVGVLPPVSESGEFGEGVVVSVLSEQCGSASPSSSASCVNDLVAENSPDPASDLLVRFRRGVDVPETIERMRAKIHAGDDQGLFLTDAGDLVNFGRVDDMPVILAGLLALLSAAALTHLLFSSVSRRRRDHAVLKTLGFTRGQVRRAYAWQATTTLIAALVFAIPLGIVAGRGLWVFLAQRLGVVAEPRVARLAVALTPLVALVLANVIAAVPARAAARTLPATVLRAE